MDTDIEERWNELVDSLAFSEKKKKAIKRYVHTILSQNGVVIIDTRHLADLIGIEDAVLNKMIVHPEKYYRVFSIPKRTGGERVIAAPYPTLMKVQRWIYETILLPRVDFFDSAIGFIPGKSVLDNANPHIGHSYVLKMDIKDFFPSISINRVISVFRNLGYHHRLAYAMASLCCLNGCLPQGAPTSPIISNIIAKRLDRRISGFALKCGLSYTRYADDLTISGEEFKPSYISFFVRVIMQEGFSPNMKKTRLLGPGVKKVITGVSISSGKATLPKNAKRLLRQQSFYIRRYGLKSHLRHEHITDPIFHIRLQGRFAFWNSLEPNNVALHTEFDSLKRAIKPAKKKNS